MAEWDGADGQRANIDVRTIQSTIQYSITMSIIMALYNSIIYLPDVPQLFFGPSPKSLSTMSPSSWSSLPTPKLEMDKLDTSPFSVSAS